MLGADIADKLEPINKATENWSPKARLDFHLDLGRAVAMSDDNLS